MEYTQFEIINAIPKSFPVELFDDNDLALKVGRWFLKHYHFDKGTARIAVYNEDFIGAVFLINQDNIDWEKDHVTEVTTKGKRLLGFDSVLTSNDTRVI